MAEPKMISDNFQQILQNLNPEQRAAVEAIDGPVMVLAGPGTGKTQLLSARIANILKNSDANAGNILCLTYTDAGAVAMKKRLTQMIGSYETSRMQISTFHSFCSKVIAENQEYFGYRNWQPISDLDRIEIVYQIIDSLPLENALKKLKGNPYQYSKQLIDLFEVMKKESFTEEYMQERIKEYVESLPFRDQYIYQKNGKDYKKGDLKIKQIEAEKEKMEKLLAGVACFHLYTKKLEQANLYDFTDMILWVIKAFKEHDVLLARYQETYQYILADEYQDTNGSQNEILDLLTSYDPDFANIFVVGDDDQSIYSFQGASMERIKDFYNQYKRNLRAFALNRNYRSRQEILDASTVLIGGNQFRLITDPDITSNFRGLSKDLKASNASITQKDFGVEAVQVVAYHNEAHEAMGIVKAIKELAAKGVELCDVAVLYRNHKDVENIRQLLEWENIAYNSRRTENVLEHPLVAQLNTLLLYLTVSSKRNDFAEELLFKILHFDFFGCHPRDLAIISIALQKEMRQESVRSIIASNEKMLRLGLQNAKQLAYVNACLENWEKEQYNSTLPMLIQNILRQSGWIKEIVHASKLSVPSGAPPAFTKHASVHDLEAINTYFNFIQNENSKRRDFTGERLLELVEKMQENYLRLNLERVTYCENGVNLITTHSSKGLEFKYVFLIRCNEKNWEGSKARSDCFSYPDTLSHAAQVEKDDNHEELRRLFFVAMTRAKEHLQLSYSLKALSDSSEEQSTLTASKFLNEVLEKYKPKQLTVRLPEEEMASFLSKTLVPALQDEAKLEKRYLDNLLQNFSLNVTKLNDYLECPLAFYYKHLLRVPEAKNSVAGYGSAVHEALQDLFKLMQTNGNEFPDKEYFLQLFYQSMAKYQNQFTGKEYEHKTEHGRRVLSDYYDYYINRWNKIVKCEAIIDTVMDDIPINGRLDKLEFNGKEVNVVDYKTAGPDNKSKELMPQGEKSELGGKYWRQLVFYKILMDTSKNKGWNMVSGEIDFVEYDRNKSFKTEKRYITPDEVQIVKGQIKEVYTRILSHDFYTGCGQEGCICSTFNTYTAKVKT